HGDAWAVAAVPRLAAQLARASAGGEPGPTGLPDPRPPLGADVWGDTALALPADAPTCWRNVLTDETVAAERGASPINGPALSLAGLLAHFPVALLIPEPR